jgi:ABC transport system ATP-binding/permease protein
MSAPAPPALTVRTNGSKRTFAPGHDVVIGRDLRADVRIADKLVSRAHVLLRFESGRWTAIDNGSLNGMFVDQRRVPTIDIRDGMSINISNPNGPRVTFEVGQVEGAVGRPPRTTVAPLQARPGGPQPPTNRPNRSSTAIRRAGRRCGRTAGRGRHPRRRHSPCSRSHHRRPRSPTTRWRRRSGRRHTVTRRRWRPA